MAIVVIAAAVLGYLGVGAAVLRPLYGWLRARQIGAISRSVYSYKNRDPVAYFEESEDEAETRAGAVTLALLWPLIPFWTGFWGMCRVLAAHMRSSKRRSSWELRRERQILANRVRDLERQAGISISEPDSG